MSLIDTYQRAREFITAYRTWFPARSFDDLTTININRLTSMITDRHIAARPAATEMLTAQIELNRAGVFTVTAQPGTVVTRTDQGEGFDPIEHRAALVAYVDEHTKDWLDESLGNIDPAYGTNKARCGMLIYDLFDPNRPETGVRGHPARPRDVSRVVRDNHYDIVGWLGGQTTAAERWEGHPTRPNVAANLFAAWQITIYATSYGPSDLFQELTQAARDAQAGGKHVTYYRY